MRYSAELEGWQNICIDVDDNEVVVTYMRPETEVERTNRERREQAEKDRAGKARKRSEAAQRNLYEKLKKKFEPAAK